MTKEGADADSSARCANSFMEAIFVSEHGKFIPWKKTILPVCACSFVEETAPFLEAFHPKHERTIQIREHDICDPFLLVVARKIHIHKQTDSPANSLLTTSSAPIFPPFSFTGNVYPQ